MSFEALYEQAKADPLLRPRFISSFPCPPALRSMHYERSDACALMECLPFTTPAEWLLAVVMPCRPVLTVRPGMFSYTYADFLSTLDHELEHAKQFKDPDFSEYALFAAGHVFRQRLKHLVKQDLGCFLEDHNALLDQKMASEVAAYEAQKKLPSYAATSKPYKEFIDSMLVAHTNRSRCCSVDVMLEECGF